MAPPCGGPKRRLGPFENGISGRVAVPPGPLAPRFATFAASDGLSIAPRLRYSAAMRLPSARSDSRISGALRTGSALCPAPLRGQAPLPSAHIHAGDDDGPGPRGPGDDDGRQDQIGIATKTRTKPKKPSQFKVLLLNDDYTPMEFVVMVLKRFFNMDLEQATRVMLHVHQKGVGICGIFPYEIAETKVNQVMDFARQNQHPLQCTLEKA